MQIANNKVVSIHYTLTDDKGATIDSSSGKEPLVYLHGIGHIIPGLESALLEKTTGDKLNVTVEPEQAYGTRTEELVQEVPRVSFEGVDELQVGMQFQAPEPDGTTQVFTIVKLEDDNVTVDGNHPLAGATLNFDVEVVEIRDASEEELEHGHVHGAGGVDHG